MGVDFLEISNPVAVILGPFEKGSKQNGANAEVLQIIQRVDNSPYVAAHPLLKVPFIILRADEFKLTRASGKPVNHEVVVRRLGCPLKHGDELFGLDLFDG